MTIPKKGSSKITVAGTRYRWRIRQKPTYCQGLCAAPLTVAVEREEQPAGSTLLLEAAFPRPDNWLKQKSISVTPGMIATSIEVALSRGWKPERCGPTFRHPLSTTNAPEVDSLDNAAN